MVLETVTVFEDPYWFIKISTRSYNQCQTLNKLKHKDTQIQKEISCYILEKKFHF